MITEQLQKDLNYTYEKLSDDEREKLSESTILITGSAGFIGYNGLRNIPGKSPKR